VPCCLSLCNFSGISGLIAFHLAHHSVEVDALRIVSIQLGLIGGRTREGHVNERTLEGEQL
jgi:hypothetical protein